MTVFAATLGLGNALIVHDITSPSTTTDVSSRGLVASDDPTDWIRNGLESDLSGTAGLAASFTIRNTTNHGIAIVSLRASLTGKSYPVHYASPNNCSGKSMSLTPGGDVPVEIFVSQLTGAEIMSAANDGDQLLIVATDIDGKDWPIAATSMKKAKDDPRLINLTQECISTFIPGGA